MYVFNGMSGAQVKISQIKKCLKIPSSVLLVEMLCNMDDMHPVKTSMINNGEPKHPNGRRVSQADCSMSEPEWGCLPLKGSRNNVN